VGQRHVHTLEEYIQVCYKCCQSKIHYHQLSHCRVPQLIRAISLVGATRSNHSTVVSQPDPNAAELHCYCCCTVLFEFKFYWLHRLTLNANIYNKLVYILQECARVAVPHKRKNFFKFWWSQELDCLKDIAIKSHQIWKTAGKPRSGPCFNQMCKDKSAYKSAIRDEQAREKSVYTNDLHEALLQKESVTFWNCWRSKFSSKDRRPHQIDGLTDETEIGNRFAEFFREACSPRSSEGAQRLKDLYSAARQNYIGTPHTSDNVFDASLVENVIVNMQRGIKLPALMD